jgi:CRISPR/Cas system-associated exonuclease Cas4 (RecB family)
MAEEGKGERAVDAAAAHARLVEEWAHHGPRDHPYGNLYWKSAELLVARAVGRRNQARGRVSRPEWEVRVPHGRISFTPDHVETIEDGTQVVERLRTGRPTKGELGKDIYALYVAAAGEATPRVRRMVLVRYLSTDTVEPVQLKRQTIDARLAKYDDAIVGILREEFPPEPSDRNCPRCPYYFICPLAEDA